MIPDIENNVNKLMNIGYLLNDIAQIITEYGINDSISLSHDKHALSSLYNKSIQVYDTALACHLIRNKDRIRRCRANVAHHTDTLTGDDALVGFDKVSPDELWQHHFSDSGCLHEVRANLINILETQPAIRDAISEKSTQDKMLPFELLSKSDYSHLPAINKAAKAIKDGMICITGLLFLLSQHQSPPTANQLESIVCKLLGLRPDQIAFAITELEINKVLSKSRTKKFLFVQNTQFAINSARHFLEDYDLEAVIKLYEESINDR